MMDSFFSLEGRYVRIMTRMFDLILLNFLLIVCSLPIITAGAAIAALYDMSLRMLRDEEVYILKGFLQAFRSNFRQATKIWLLALAVTGIAAGDVLAGRLLTGYGLQYPLLIIAGVQVLILILILQYAFALTARFENTIMGTLKNSLLLTMSHLPQTLWMSIVGTSFIWILLMIPMPDKILYCFIAMVLMFWISGSIYRNCKRIHHIFQQHFGSEKKTDFNGE